MSDLEGSRCAYEYIPPGMHNYMPSKLDTFDCSRKTVEGSEYCIWHFEKERKNPRAIFEARKEKPESLNGCYLQNTILNNHTRATSQGKKWTFPELDFKECVLAEANLAQGMFMAVDFSNAILKEANFNNCQLSDAVLHDVDAVNAEFSEANLTKADLSEADLRGATLTEAHLHSANLSGAHISSPDFGEADLEEANFNRSTIREADFTEAEINNTTFAEANIGGSVDLSGCNLQSCDFSSASLDFVDFSGADLSEADLTGAHLGHADLSNANLQGTKLDNTYLEGANLEGAKLERAELRNATLSDVNLQSTDLRYTKFNESSIQDANVSNADARGAIFCKASLEGTNLRNTDLRGSDLRLTATYNSVFDNVIINEQTKFGDICIYEQASEEYLEEQEKEWGFGGASDYRIRTNRHEKTEWVYRQYESLSRRHSLPRQAQKFYIRQKNARRKNVWRETAIYKHLIRYSKTLSEVDEKKREDNDIDNSNERPCLSKENRRQTTFTRTRNVIGKIRQFIDYVAEFPLLRAMWNEFHRWTTLYGESPWRVVTVSIVVISLWTFFYPLTQGITGEKTYSYSLISEPKAEVGLETVLAKSFYFSLVSFTTVGFGDLKPIGTTAQWLAGLESFLGALLIALLVFTLGRRVTR